MEVKINMMSGLSLQNNFDLCYPILEKDLFGVCNKINSTLDNRVSIYELRIDYLLNNGININDIIIGINDLIKCFPNKKFIVTIRTKSEGGVIELSLDEYFTYIKMILTELNATYVDVEYKYYILGIDSFNTLIESAKSKVILSKHVFDNKFSRSKCEKIINKLIEGKGSIVKLATMVSTKDELFSFMNIAKKNASELKINNKDAIFIAMGAMGRLSRVYPEYTNTRIVFINAYDKSNTLGQYSLNTYIEYRELLAKLGKN